MSHSLSQITRMMSSELMFQLKKWEEVRDSSTQRVQSYILERKSWRQMKPVAQHEACNQQHQPPHHQQEPLHDNERKELENTSMQSQSTAFLEPYLLCGRRRWGSEIFFKDLNFTSTNYHILTTQELSVRSSVCRSLQLKKKYDLWIKNYLVGRGEEVTAMMISRLRR